MSAERLACPGCGNVVDWAKEPFCRECWGKIPASMRRALHVAQKALGYNPASPKAREAFDVALADAAGCT